MLRVEKYTYEYFVDKENKNIFSFPANNPIVCDDSNYGKDA